MSISFQTELFVHAFKDQLVRSALLALYTARPGGVLKKPPSPKSGTEESISQDPPLPVRRQDSIPHHSDYDEEEWVSLLLFFNLACLPSAIIKSTKALAFSTVKQSRSVKRSLLFVKTCWKAVTIQIVGKQVMFFSLGANYK